MFRSSAASALLRTAIVGVAVVSVLLANSNNNFGDGGGTGGGSGGGWLLLLPTCDAQLTGGNFGTAATHCSRQVAAYVGCVGLSGFSGADSNSTECRTCSDSYAPASNSTAATTASCTDYSKAVCDGISNCIDLCFPNTTSKCLQTTTDLFSCFVAASAAGGNNGTCDKVQCNGTNTNGNGSSSASTAATSLAAAMSAAALVTGWIVVYSSLTAL
jgi:hypothetical protein